MKLSKVERLILSNQYRILERVDDKDRRQDHAFARKTIERGYERDIDTLTDDLREWFDLEKCDFVVDVFAMHQTLQWSQAALEGIDDAKVRMLGFDGRGEEAPYLGYAKFIFDSGAFTEVKFADWVKPDLNSHMPTLQRYRDMLERWNSVRENQPSPFELDRESLLFIIDGTPPR